ncbi:MAG: acyl dehydratase [Pseudomonadota bacterium]
MHESTPPEHSAPAHPAPAQSAPTRLLAETLDPWPANALRATLALERPAFGPGDALPPFWHWLYFREALAPERLGPDGHPATGGFIPAVAQPRRMWAGGRLGFLAPLRLGQAAEHRARVTEVRETRGRSGALSFVSLRNEIRALGADTPAIIEEQDLVYRNDPPPDAPQRAPEQAPRDETHTKAWCFDTTALFRYSALTFNGHRIHYDADYARDVEGYAGLVVHGPLLATVLLELAHEIAGPPAYFSFRARSPVIADEAVTACARADEDKAALWIRASDGRLAMQAEAKWSRDGCSAPVLG